MIIYKDIYYFNDIQYYIDISIFNVNKKNFLNSFPFLKKVLYIFVFRILLRLFLLFFQVFYFRTILKSINKSINQNYNFDKNKSYNNQIWELRSPRYSDFASMIFFVKLLNFEYNQKRRKFIFFNFHYLILIFKVQ